MAKFVKTVEINVGDEVDFSIEHKKIIHGVVQSITEFPEIFVETGDPHKKWPAYNRYRISVDQIVEVCNKYDGFVEYSTSFEDNEPLEFVYDENYNRKILSRYSSSNNKK